MDKLLEIVSKNKYANDTTTIAYISQCVLRDAKYSHENLLHYHELLKYYEYKHLTIGQIKELLSARA